MKNSFLISIFFLFILLPTNAQKGHVFGELTAVEKELTVYIKDPSAHAVVLYEWGDNYFDVFRNSIRLIKKYHVKIKILDEKGFDEGTISIKYLNDEKIKKIKTLIHNDNDLTSVSESQIYTTQLNKFTNELKFTYPSLKVGSIIEYEYTLESPYIYRLNGWEFQSHIPKIHSEYNARIPGMYVYNRALYGSLSLHENSAKVKKGCFKSTFLKWDCEELIYVMKNIPAFNSDSNFMLSASNYMSRIEFELAEIVYTNGQKQDVSSTWEEIDSDYKNAESIGEQLTKKNFFARKVPDKLFDPVNQLDKAKMIYSFVQEHFNWNNTFGSYNYSNVKEAFRIKKGSVSEINMSLINLLNAAGIKADLMLISTRENGLPKKIHPVVYDFNYFVAKLKIGEKDYLLDASDKNLSFGMLPFRCLNHYGRVMDFENKSYWYDITPFVESKKMIRGKLTFDPVNKKALGIFDELNYGYDAVFKRQKISNNSETEYFEDLENSVVGNFDIISYKIVEERSDDKKITERIEYEIENVLESDNVYFNPFITKFFDKNPFLLEERNYPIDFGYKRNYTFSISIEVPNGYSVDQLPEKIKKVLSDNMGLLQFETSLTGNNITVYFNLSLNKTHYLPENYNELKELFANVVTVQNNTVIVLKKK
ncbi:hypothetical protein GGR42_003111 [Saonia flava]|uniref:DUF3857 domain-containing protein n=1 Tax=Saonia flava TaxID=523696 RepID=A0A846R0D5_9FLAO|nr:DUF3857 domain-containing protein [Saonia flava]NJB72620.1 hypothetical protein [Saonia flava]